MQRFRGITVGNVLSQDTDKLLNRCFLQCRSGTLLLNLEKLDRQLVRELKFPNFIIMKPHFLNIFLRNMVSHCFACICMPDNLQIPISWEFLYIV